MSPSRRSRGTSDARRASLDPHLRRLEMVIQNITNMIVVTNRSREIQWVNPAYTAVTGWTLEEVRGKNPRSFLHGPRTSLKAASRLGELLRTGQSVKDFEMLNYKKSGEPYWVSLSIQPIVDRLGQVCEYVAIQVDITERKQRELEAARTLRRLGEAQRIAKLGHMEHDLTTGMVHCSAEVFRILDANDPEGVASYESLIACTHPDDLPVVRKRYEQAVNDGGPYESEHRILSRTGRIKWVHMLGALEGWDDGTPALCRLTVQDVTERKQTEHTLRERDLLEQASRTQMLVLSRVSHELRTPLHAVLGFTEMVERLESMRLSDRSKGHLRHIRESALHLLLIVNDILDLTRMQDGRVKLDSRPLELAAAARDVATLLEPLAAERRVTIEVAEPGAPIAALADRQRLVQILINLVANGIKYNRPGGRVTLRFKRIGDASVATAVEDTGVGIAPEHLDRLFEPFYRISDGAVTLPANDSSGLGLAIAKSLAQAMGGDIVVESALGKGSSFVLTLPASRPVQVAPPPQADDADEEAPHTGGTLLYIEDNELNCLLVEGFLLARPEIRIHCRPTGAAGLDAARRLQPDLILVDVNLPDMSGHEVVRAILDDPELHRTPCIAFSADAQEADIEAAIRSGFREFLCKPIGAGEFLSVVDRLMGADALATRL